MTVDFLVPVPDAAALVADEVDAICDWSAASSLALLADRRARRPDHDREPGDRAGRRRPRRRSAGSCGSGRGRPRQRSTCRSAGRRLTAFIVSPRFRARRRRRARRSCSGRMKSGASSTLENGSAALTGIAEIGAEPPQEARAGRRATRRRRRSRPGPPRAASRRSGSTRGARGRGSASRGGRRRPAAERPAGRSPPSRRSARARARRGAPRPARA